MLGDHLAALATRGELEGRLHERADGVGEEAGELVEALEFLAVVFGEGGLVVPGIDLAGPPLMKIQMTRLALAGKWDCFGKGIGGLAVASAGAKEAFVIEEGGKPEETGAGTGAFEEGAAGEKGAMECRDVS